MIEKYNPSIKITLESTIARLKIYNILPSKLPQNQNFNMNYIEIPVKEKSPIDQHEDNEYWFLLSGKGLLIFENKEFTMYTKKVFFFPPNTQHQAINTGRTKLIICSIFWV